MDCWRRLWNKIYDPRLKGFYILALVSWMIAIPCVFFVLSL